MTPSETDSCGIEQINLTYEPTEDRLLLRLRGADAAIADLWLTRRLCRGLLPGLVGVAERTVGGTDVGARREVLAFRHAQAVAGADYARPFDDQGSPLLADGPILVREVSVRPSSGSAWRIEFNGRDGRSIAINLDARSLHGVIKLFDDLLPATGWDLPAARPEGARDAAGQVVH